MGHGFAVFPQQCHGVFRTQFPESGVQFPGFLGQSTQRSGSGLFCCQRLKQGLNSALQGIGGGLFLLPAGQGIQICL